MIDSTLTPTNLSLQTPSTPTHAPSPRHEGGGQEGPPGHAAVRPSGRMRGTVKGYGHEKQSKTCTDGGRPSGRRIRGPVGGLCPSPPQTQTHIPRGTHSVHSPGRASRRAGGSRRTAPPPARRGSRKRPSPPTLPPPPPTPPPRAPVLFSRHPVKYPLPHPIPPPRPRAPIRAHARFSRRRPRRRHAAPGVTRRPASHARTRAPSTAPRIRSSALRDSGSESEAEGGGDSGGGGSGAHGDGPAGPCRLILIVCGSGFESPPPSASDSDPPRGARLASQSPAARGWRAASSSKSAAYYLPVGQSQNISHPRG